MKIIPTTDLIAPRLVEFATACGETLARAHARTGDPMAIDAYIGKGAKFAAAIGRFARSYADQNSGTMRSSSAPSRPAPWRACRADRPAVGRKGPAVTAGAPVIVRCARLPARSDGPAPAL